ncbi:Cuticlin-1 [Toxocara canis]|uniref:Cuticlin-1 n=1 Tax=Toxocara canis TaxID=6265 RepID=A0A0B2W6H9_TOXCA|nr:Cuticlin-1 [Toxocara canis]
MEVKEEEGVASDATASELSPQFDISAPRPKCTYAIRRDSIDGPKVHYATVGQTVFHVWECRIDGVQILVQNCYVEDGQGNRILIIDQNGCGVDQYILPTPRYSKDLRVASQETRVFKFAGKTVTRFACQIRLCSTEKENCNALTPPRHCPTFEERIALQRRFYDDSQIDSPGGTTTGLQSAVHQISEATRPNISTPRPPRHCPTFEERIALQRRFYDDSQIDSPGGTTTGLQSAVHQISEATRPNISTPRVMHNEDRAISNATRRTIRSVHMSVKPHSVDRITSEKDQNETQLDVVGLLTILDSPDDVKFFESNASTFGFISCLSHTSYMALIVALIVVCLLHIFIVFLCVSNVRHLKTIFSAKFIPAI